MLRVVCLCYERHGLLHIISSATQIPCAGRVYPFRLGCIADVGQTFNSSTTLAHLLVRFAEDKRRYSRSCSTAYSIAFDRFTVYSAGSATSYIRVQVMPQL